MDREEQLETYLIKYIHHELTPEELVDFQNFLEDHREDRALLVKCLSVYKNYRKMEFIRSRGQQEAWQVICEKRGRLRQLRLRRMVSYAAVLLLLVGMSISGSIYFYNNLSPVVVENAQAGEKPQIILTLSGGRKVVLGEGQKVIDEDGKVVIKDSLTYLSYQRLVSSKTEIEYNELTIPRGAFYSLVLADGTKVWLNSDSYLRYPVFFPKDFREVELVGEAYFEVERDVNRPFAVKVGTNRIEVLGTHFNISAYGKESLVYTTLAEGSVRVKTLKEEKVLIPGEQAGMLWGGEKLEIKEVDTDLFTSWHLGVYEFRNTPLGEISRCLARWYDVEVQFRSENMRDIRFTGAFQRKDSLNFTLENLEKISGLQFLLEGKKVVVVTK